MDVFAHIDVSHSLFPYPLSRMGKTYAQMRIKTNKVYSEIIWKIMIISFSFSLLKPEGELVQIT